MTQGKAHATSEKLMWKVKINKDKQEERNLLTHYYNL